MAGAHWLAGVVPSTAYLMPGGVVRRPVEVYRPEKIYLFGSVARSEAAAESGYGLMMIVPDASTPASKQDRSGCRAHGGIGVPRDFFVPAASDFDEHIDLSWRF